MRITSIPQVYSHLNRWREILGVLSKYGLADWLSRFQLDIAKGFLKARNGEALARYSRETRIRLAMEELGPTFIKIGQILSTRPDLIGPELAVELRRLQTEVQPDPPAKIRKRIEKELGKPVDQLFSEFEDRPLASASIGQVHRARLKSGERVVVKVRHEGIERRMRIDMDILSGLAQMAERVPEFVNYRPQSTVAEFQRTLRRELDFNRERRNLLLFKRDFAKNKHVRIPATFEDLSTTRVLTMELLEGIKFSDLELQSYPADQLDEITHCGAQIFLEMIFSHGFYHADPHPGNLLVLEGCVIGLLDYGMVGRLHDDLREDVEAMLMAIADGDAIHLTSLIIRLGAVPQGFDEAGLRVDLAEYVEHYSNQPVEAFDLSGALQEMFDLIRRYQIMLPAPTALLLKVFIMLEGTGRLLTPRFSLMEVIQPYRRKVMMRRLSPTRQIRRLRRIFYDTEQLAEVLPRRLIDLLDQVQSGRFDVHLDHRGLEPSVNRLVLGLLTSALFLGSVIMLKSNIGPMLFGLSIMGTLGCLLSLGLGMRLLRAINKSGHLDRRK